MRQARTRMQMIFQDPISSLNPRRKVRDIVMEPLTIWKRGTKASATQVDARLEEVGIDPARAAERRPHQFSGGQCQRISIARSLVLDPRLIICDEPVSALDVSVQAQVLNLLEDLKAAPRPDADLHRPRPRGGQEHQRPRRRDVPRQAVRGGPERRRCTGPRPTPYTNVLLARSRSPTRSAAPAGRRSSASRLAGPPAARLPLPHPLPVGHRRVHDDEPQLRELGAGHYVACHHPVIDSAVAITTRPSVTAAASPTGRHGPRVR